MSKKVKIGFEPKDCWELEIFRDYIDKLKQCEEIELYIISSEANTKLINYIKTRTKIPDAKYWRYYTFTEKVEAIDLFDLNIFMEGDPSEWSKLDAIGLTTIMIHVDYKIDKFYLVQRFIMETQDAIKEIKKSLNIC